MARDVDPTAEVYRNALDELDAEGRLFEQAVSELRRFARLHPNDPQGCDELADLLCQRAKTAEIVGELRRFLAQNRGNAALRAKIEQILQLQEPVRQPEPASGP